MFVQSEISAGRCVGRPCPFRLPNHPFRLCLADHSIGRSLNHPSDCAWPITRSGRSLDHAWPADHSWPITRSVADHSIDRVCLADHSGLSRAKSRRPAVLAVPAHSDCLITPSDCAWPITRSSDQSSHSAENANCEQSLFRAKNSKRRECTAQLGVVNYPRRFERGERDRASIQ
jgi:hypothetical protein